MNCPAYSLHTKLLLQSKAKMVDLGKAKVLACLPEVYSSPELYSKEMLKNDSVSCSLYFIVLRSLRYSLLTRIPTRLKTDQAFIHTMDPRSIGNPQEKPISEDDPTVGYTLNHLMLRIRDPKASLHFYTNLLGMRTIFSFEVGPATIYYLGYPKTPEHRKDPAKFASETAANMMFTPGLLELVHVHGAETADNGSYRYTSGCDPPNLGFGHVGITVPDVPAALARLEKEGVEIVSRVGETGRDAAGFTQWEADKGIGLGELDYGFAEFVIKKIGFVKDPVCIPQSLIYTSANICVQDGYYIELVPQNMH